MDFETTWGLFEELRGKPVAMLCTDGDIVTGHLIDVMDAYDNDYGVIFF